MVTPLRQRLGRGGRGTLGTCKASPRVSRKRTARMPPPVGQVSSQRPGQTSACRRGRPRVAAAAAGGCAGCRRSALAASLTRAQRLLSSNGRVPRSSRGRRALAESYVAGQARTVACMPCVQLTSPLPSAFGHLQERPLRRFLAGLLRKRAPFSFSFASIFISEWVASSVTPAPQLPDRRRGAAGAPAAAGARGASGHRSGYDL